MSIFSIFKKNKYQLGCYPDYPDIRDYQLLEIQEEKIKLPDSFLLIDKMLSIQKQNWGSCTSHAVDGVKEFQERIKLSQRFIYYNTKKISGLWNNQGDYIRNALKSVVKYGVCEEKDFIDTRDGNWNNYVKKEPSHSCYEKAEKYKGLKYFSVGRNIENFKQAIYQNKCPVATGMKWFEDYKKIQSDGKLPLPGGKSLGGHAISCIGWSNNRLWFRNSWGEKWGYKGYFYIPFEEFEKHEIWNAWILLDLPEFQKLEGWVAEKYIVQVKKFKIGEKVKSTTKGLRIREIPMGKILGKFGIDKTAIILEDKDNGILKDNHRWWKIKIEF